MEGTRVMTIDPNKMKNKVLVIVAHADDEVIGCGGTLLKHRDQGDEIHVIYMTDGVGARSSAKQAEKESLELIKIKQRLDSQQNACKQLTVTKFYNFDFPDNQMDQVPLIEITQTIESVLNHYQANIIYTHHGGDLNVDHRIVHQAVLTACRPQPQSTIEKILTFEVNSSTEWSSISIGTTFVPNYYVDVSSYQIEKKELLTYYQQEMKPDPHSRSINGILNLNKSRGNHVGLECAEAFMLTRQIVK